MPPAKQARTLRNRQTSQSFEPSAALLDWYDRHRRRLPWRAAPGRQADPYRVWLSEIMLQQTTVAAVEPYYRRFLEKWPTLEALAAAELGEVLETWAGLGYYSRARNLHKCARAVVEHHGGAFPETEKALLALPGIGPYTAAAMQAIAFERPANVVDGNVERVMARYFALHEPLPAAKPELKERAATLLPKRRFGDYAQALMDLGATICTPRRPACASCPLAPGCAALAEGCASDLPRRMTKAPKPLRRGAVFWLQRPDGAVLLRRRPETGLLGGMMEVPTSDWVKADGPGAVPGLEAAPVAAEWQRLAGLVRHTFTHFHLELDVYAARLRRVPRLDGLWVMPADLEAQALPSVMKKVARLAQTALGGA